MSLASPPRTQPLQRYRVTFRAVVIEAIDAETAADLAAEEYVDVDVVEWIEEV